MDGFRVSIDFSVNGDARLSFELLKFEIFRGNVQSKQGFLIAINLKLKIGVHFCKWKKNRRKIQQWCLLSIVEFVD
jgi:hypothetical protein